MGLSTINAFKHIQSEQSGVVLLTNEQLQALQRTLNSMLKDVVSCCKKHGLTYELGGGSCLGAVRHHGFIPWDDDVDLNMPRKDHDIFVRCFAQEYGDRYWVHTPEQTKGYGLTLSRVLLKGTSVKTREDFHNEECGAFIDIFVIENTYDNGLLRWVHGVGALALGLVQSCAKFYRDRIELMELVSSVTDEKERKQYRRIFRIKIAIGALTHFRSLDDWTKAADRWYSRCSNTESKYVSIPSGRKHFFGELYERKTILPGVRMEYEGEQYLVPRNYDVYLTRMYGDYMILPREEDRERHIFFSPFVLPREQENEAND